MVGRRIRGSGVVLAVLLLIGLIALGGCAAAPGSGASTPLVSSESPSPSSTATPLTATATPTLQATATPSPTATDTATVTSTATATSTFTPTPPPSPTPSPSATPTLPPPTPTATPLPSPTATQTPVPATPTNTSIAPPRGSPSPTAPAGSADVGLDPGHHRLDVGASGGGVREYEATLDVAQRAKRLLEAKGLSVALSRTDNEPVSAWNAADSTEIVRQEQEARVRAVGKVRAFVSIHFNAFSDSSLSGTETYYNGDNAGPESRRLAAALQSGVLAQLKEAGYSSRDRGVKEDLAAGKPYGHFFSLRGGMPSALVESLFLSNPTEAGLVGKVSTRDAIARGIAEGIVAYLNR